MAAGAALIDMAAERGGPTPSQRAEDRPLLHAESRMSFEKAVTRLSRRGSAWLRRHPTQIHARPFL
jgi:hypothetical protein